MEYRRFGRTNIAMPVVTLGCMRFQESWDRGKPVSKKCQHNLEILVERALASGIYHFETARGYGTSEKQLGRILPHLPRQEIVLQTKVGPRKSQKEFLSDVEDSMKTLRVDYLDMLSLHGVNTEQILMDAQKRTGSIRAMIKLREEGIVRHIGLSTHGPPSVNMMTVKTGIFEYINLWYSYIYQDNWDVLMEAGRRDMGVLVISPNDKGGMLYKPSRKMRDLTRPLTPMQFNDLFSLIPKEIHTLSVGAARPSELKQHVDAVKRSKAWASSIRRIARRLDKAMRDAVGADWAKGYAEGLPDWRETPGEMNIQSILWLRNLVLAYDLLAYGKMRYNLLGNAGHWFPGNKADKIDSLDSRALRRVLRKSPFKEEVIEALREADAILSGQEVKRLGGRH